MESGRGCAITFNPKVLRVEISYFRSVYKTSLSSLEDLNVISGRNDAGKSNVLRALNLFFNGQTDWGQPLRFRDDFSRQRLHTVREETVKGKQFIRVKLRFKRPSGYKNSLPEEFTVTRKWDRHGNLKETSNLRSLSRRGKLPSTEKIANQQLSRLLNRVHFEYVPAVKNREYYNHLLARLQRTLLDKPGEIDQTVSQSASKLASHIETKIEALKDDFRTATGVDVSISPPEELSGLYRAFDVSTRIGQGLDVSLFLRGDGVQARYLASVLHYISSNSTDFFIWGFEEPENSLELRHAFDLARDMKNTYSSGTQVFVTSHSPAFCGLEGENVRLFHAIRDSESRRTEVIDTEASGARFELLRELGILSLQKELADELRTRIEILENEQKEFERAKAELQSLAAPTIIVEGPTDRSFLQRACELLRPNLLERVEFLVADNGAGEDGSGGATMVKKVLEAALPMEERRLVGLFDSDHLGIAQFRKLPNHFENNDTPPNSKSHGDGKIHALLLQPGEDQEAYVSAKNLSVEFLFPEKKLTEAEEKGIISFEDPKGTLIIGQTEITDYTPHDVDLTAHRKLSSGKKQFAEWAIGTFEEEDFQGFTPTIDALEDLLADD